MCSGLWKNLFFFYPKPLELLLKITVSNNTRNWPAVAGNTLLICATEYLENPNRINLERVPNSHNFMSLDKYSQFSSRQILQVLIFFFHEKKQKPRKQKETVKNLYSQISSYGSCLVCERSWSSQDSGIFTSAEQCNSKTRKKEEEGSMTADCDVEDSNRGMRSKQTFYLFSYLLLFSFLACCFWPKLI